MPRDYTDITIILDRSWSMHSCREGTIGGINNLIDKQKQVPGEGSWSLVQFDTQRDAQMAREAFPHVVFSNRPQDKVELLTDADFKPRGGTALHDAVCMTMDSIGMRLASMHEDDRPSRVMVVIVTDGENNSSVKFTASDVKQRINHQREKYNWQVLFLGANIDVDAQAEEYGLPVGSAMAYTSDNTGAENMYCAVSRAVRDWKADGNPQGEVFLTPSDPDPVNVNVNVQVR